MLIGLDMAPFNEHNVQSSRGALSMLLDCIHLSLLLCRNPETKFPGQMEDLYTHEACQLKSIVRQYPLFIDRNSHQVTRRITAMRRIPFLLAETVSSCRWEYLQGFNKDGSDYIT